MKGNLRFTIVSFLDAVVSSDGVCIVQRRCNSDKGDTYTSDLYSLCKRQDLGVSVCCGYVTVVKSGGTCGMVMEWCERCCDGVQQRREKRKQFTSDAWRGTSGTEVVQV